MEFREILINRIIFIEKLDIPAELFHIPYSMEFRPSYSLEFHNMNSSSIF